jgi:uncharacterized protein (DUF2132 family)
LIRILKQVIKVNNTHTDIEIYLLIKYVKSVPWRAEKCLSYIEEVRCLKVKVNGADLTHRTIIFVPVTQHLGGHQLYSKKNAGA